jgi:Fe2+ or Zn2+ uptake regulation protein
MITCFFADHRATVYSVLEQLLASGLIEELKQN